MRCLRISRYFLLLMLLINQFALADKSKKKKAYNNTSYVIACTIHFPHDSIVFRKKRIDECLKGLDSKLITYIHIFATASTKGSPEYNLNLSNKRAVVVEKEVRKRYPAIKIVHSFGGGENPTFGRLARIFVVAQKPEKKVMQIAEQPPQVVKEVPKEPEIRYITKTKIKYVERSLRGLRILTYYGKSAYKDQEYKYQKIAVGAYLSKEEYAKLIGLNNLDLGLLLDKNQSDEKTDIDSYLLSARTTWNLLKFYNGDITISAVLNGGIIRNYRKRTYDLGVGSDLAWTKNGFHIGIDFKKSYQLTSFGLFAGVDI